MSLSNSLFLLSSRSFFIILLGLLGLLGLLNPLYSLTDRSLHSDRLVQSDHSG
jgi:hypothetical protein